MKNHSSKRTGLIEILQQLLPKVNSVGMCVAKHSNDKCQAFDRPFMPCFASLTEAYRCAKFVSSLEIAMIGKHQSKRILNFVMAYSI